MKLSLLATLCSPSCRPVARVASTHSAVQALSGVQLRAARTAAPSCAPPTSRSACACRSRPRSTAKARSCCRPGCCSRSSARCPTAGVAGAAARAEQDVELTVRRGHLPHPHPARRGLPAACPSPSATRAVEVPAAAFVETVQTVARAASRDDTRPVLTGILVSASARELRMVATDSYRLSVKETALEAALDGSFEANVPARALQELARLAQQADDETRSPWAWAPTRWCSRSTAPRCPRG